MLFRTKKNKKRLQRSIVRIKEGGTIIKEHPYTFVCDGCHEIQRTYDAEYLGVIGDYHITHVTCPSCGKFHEHKNVTAIAYFCYGVR